MDGPKENPAVGATGSNQALRENNSWIVAVIGSFAEAFAVCTAVGAGLIGVVELVRWLGGAQ